MYMHSRNICHRDLKLENVMYESSSLSNNTIKLIDFGLSEKYTKNTQMSKACGTIYTAAPEVLTGKAYTTQTDVWSAGVCAYCLLSSAVPFMSDVEDMRDPAQVLKLTKAKVSFAAPIWELVSKRGRDFVATCLRAHPGARWKARAALENIRTVWIPALEVSKKKPSHPPFYFLPPKPSPS